jgi:hypothetical protein
MNPTPEEIRKFFIDRPNININKTEKELGMAQGTLSKFLREERNIKEKYLPDLYKYMQHYGFKD